MAASQTQHEMTRVALIGVGRWGKNILRALDSRCQVVLCCNKSNPGVHTWLQEYYPHVRSTFGFQEALADNIDAVVIASPIETHYPLAQNALDAGKHVFIEKPLATSISDARNLVELAAKQGLTLCVGHVFLYDPALAIAKELMRQDPLSDTRMAWTKYGTFEEDIFWNLVSHEVAIALDLYQECPREVYVLHRSGDVTANDTVKVRLRFSQDRDCLLDVNRVASTKSKRVTMRTAAGGVLVWEGHALYRHSIADKHKLVYQGTEEPLVLEIEAFLRSVRSGVPTRSDGLLGLQVVEVVSQLLKVAERD